MNLLPNKNLTSTAYFAKNLPVSQIFRLANPNLTKIHNSEKNITSNKTAAFRQITPTT